MARTAESESATKCNFTFTQCSTGGWAGCFRQQNTKIGRMYLLCMGVEKTKIGRMYLLWCDTHDAKTDPEIPDLKTHMRARNAVWRPEHCGEQKSRTFSPRREITNNWNKKRREK